MTTLKFADVGFFPISDCFDRRLLTFLVSLGKLGITYFGMSSSFFSNIFYIYIYIKFINGATSYISFSDTSHTIYHIAFYLSWIRNRLEQLVISSVCQPDTSSVKCAILKFKDCHLQQGLAFALHYSQASCWLNTSVYYGFTELWKIQQAVCDCIHALWTHTTYCEASIILTCILQVW